MLIVRDQHRAGFMFPVYTVIPGQQTFADHIAPDRAEIIEEMCSISSYWICQYVFMLIELMLIYDRPVDIPGYRPADNPGFHKLPQGLKSGLR